MKYNKKEYRFNKKEYSMMLALMLALSHWAHRHRRFRSAPASPATVDSIRARW